MAGIQLSVEEFTVPVATLRDTKPGYCVVGAQTAAAIRQKDKTRLFMPSLSRQCLRLRDNVGGTPSFHARESLGQRKDCVFPRRDSGKSIFRHAKDAIEQEILHQADGEEWA